MLDLRSKEQKQVAKLEAKIYQLFHSMHGYTSISFLANVIHYQYSNPVNKLKNLILAIQDGHELQLLSLTDGIMYVNGRNQSIDWLDNYKETRKQKCKSELENHLMYTAFNLKERHASKTYIDRNLIAHELMEDLRDCGIIKKFIYKDEEPQDNFTDKQANNFDYLITLIADYISDLNNQDSDIYYYFIGQYQEASMQ